MNRLRVVNDTAEKDVKLITDYNSCITKHEEQRQYPLQVVAECRAKFSGCSKTSLSWLNSGQNRSLIIIRLLPPTQALKRNTRSVVLHIGRVKSKACSTIPLQANSKVFGSDLL